MYSKTLIIAAALGAVQAHMHLDFPPTILGDNNPFTPEGGADPKLNYPYGCCGQTVVDYCKGHLDLFNGPEGQSVVTWEAGQAANFTLSGHSIKNSEDTVQGGTHAGGSCQCGFSTDKGKTFKVVKTWQGNCPNHDKMSLDPADHVFDFTVPADMPSGDAIFAWTWINREKEFNMNCAAVTIAGGNGESPPPEDEDPSETPAPTPTGGAETPTETSRPGRQRPDDSETQYTLEGCTCSCPAQTWSQGCECYNCESPRNRRVAARKAVAMHKRNLQLKNAPRRRAESVAFASRPDMALDIDIPGKECHSAGNPAEVRFPDPGPDVEEVEGNDGYELVEPTCG
jgi:hypothetical protein